MYNFSHEVDGGFANIYIYIFSQIELEIVPKSKGLA
jgi:hypothetical protein